MYIEPTTYRPQFQLTCQKCWRVIKSHQDHICPADIPPITNTGDLAELIAKAHEKRACKPKEKTWPNL